MQIQYYAIESGSRSDSAGSLMASIPSFFGLGAAGNPTTGAATVAWPAGHQVGDIGISFVESAANSTPSILTASGFVFGDASTFSATSTFAFAWARATSNAMANMQWQGRSDHQQPQHFQGGQTQI
jgi:Tfp pilus assembly protein PilW